MQALSTDFFEPLLHGLDLGRVIQVADLKPGLDIVARVDTERGSFHVKAFPLDAWPGMVDQLRGSAQVERAALAAGVAMAEPLRLGEVIDAHVVNVHRWIEGRTVTQDDIADWAGRTLARMHTTIAPPPPPVEDVWSDTYGAEVEWDEPLLRDAAALVREAAAEDERVVGSQRDLHALNVIIDEHEQPHLVDWELAGRVRPWFEITRGAIDLGRNAAGHGTERALHPDHDTVRRMIAAYLDAGGERGPTDERALAGTFGVLLARFRYFRNDAEFLARNLEKLRERWARRHEVLGVIASV